ncbi:TIGR03808 family TAT-translocated repetitive protein [Nostoc sp. 3335mG]|nr:TIGR03808 family TAT-translocated repetitive protein [Nostoc sp. 3335mG]
MRQNLDITRRHALAGLAGLTAMLPVAARAQVADLAPDSDADQSPALQAALDGASGRLALPAGRFRVSNIGFPPGLVVEGVPGATWLVASGTAIGGFLHQSGLVLRDIGFTGDSGEDPLFGIQDAADVTLERCSFAESPGIALSLFQSAATVRDCSFLNHDDAAIHALDSRGVLLTGNRIDGCGNAGIRIWQSEQGVDGSIVTNNRIANIDWKAGGNGQNGNGVNVYLADEVIVSDNHISDCAFTAVRLNTTRNSIVSGNQCRTCGEVAIFSEFGFSGSIITENLIDGAATGISITNLDSEGHLAVCSNNIVRNISEKSAVNPDTVPVGIYVEAEVAVTGNVVENVPGVALAAGFGSFMRSIVISGNVVYSSDVGVGVSVAEGAGRVLISDNMVHEPGVAEIVGLKWTEIAEPDLRAVVDKYPHVTIR